MKTYFIIFFLISLNSIGKSQEIPKKANLIVFASDSLKDFDLFKACILALKSEGYSFEKLDKDFYLCSTTPIHPRGSNFKYRIDISVNINKVEIRSYVFLLLNVSSNMDGVVLSQESSWERGANRGLSSSIWRYGWEKQLSFFDKIKETLAGTATFIIE